jgi:hypothetical protein
MTLRWPRATHSPAVAASWLFEIEFLAPDVEALAFTFG